MGFSIRHLVMTSVLLLTVVPDLTSAAPPTGMVWVQNLDNARFDWGPELHAGRDRIAFVRRNSFFSAWHTFDEHGAELDQGTGDYCTIFERSAIQGRFLYLVGSTAADCDGDGRSPGDALITKVDAKGETLWERGFGKASADDSVNGLVAGRERVFVAGIEGERFLRAYTPKGKLLWHKSLTLQNTSSLMKSGELLFLIGAGSIEARDLDGKKVWGFRPGQTPLEATVSGKHVYVLAGQPKAPFEEQPTCDNELIQLSVAGKEKWRMNLDQSVCYPQDLAVAGRSVYLLGTTDNYKDEQAFIQVIEGGELTGVVYLSPNPDRATQPVSIDTRENEIYVAGITYGIGINNSDVFLGRVSGAAQPSPTPSPSLSPSP
jgi:hypothetical protein